uniref:Uncharacterized protein n=1 Tax=Moniliophthora roreri TaxID=221103 RepID=A0A0W0FFV9_MONRR
MQLGKTGSSYKYTLLKYALQLHPQRVSQQAAGHSNSNPLNTAELQSPPLLAAYQDLWVHKEQQYKMCLSPVSWVKLPPALVEALRTNPLPSMRSQVEVDLHLVLAQDLLLALKTNNFESIYSCNLLLLKLIQLEGSCLEVAQRTWGGLDLIHSSHNTTLDKEAPPVNTCSGSLSARNTSSQRKYRTGQHEQFVSKDISHATIEKRFELDILEDAAFEEEEGVGVTDVDFAHDKVDGEGRVFGGTTMEKDEERALAAEVGG